MAFDTPCLTLSIIRYVPSVKWSNPGKRVAPFPKPRCSSYWKGSLLVAFDYGRLRLWSPTLFTYWIKCQKFHWIFNMFTIDFEIIEKVFLSKIIQKRSKNAFCWLTPYKIWVRNTYIYWLYKIYNIAARVFLGMSRYCLVVSAWGRS